MTPKQIEILPKPFLAVYDYVVFYLGLLWLGLISLCWTIVSVPMYFLLPSRFSTRFGRLAIMAIFRSYLAGLAFSGRFVFELQELDCLNTDTPLIVAPNHPCLLDAVMVLSRLPKLTCVMKTDLMNSVFWGGGARLARYIRNEPIRHMVQQATKEFKQGNPLLLFPEGTRTTTAPINPLKGSIALIAYQAQVPVQTVLIETNSPYLTKGCKVFQKPKLPIYYTVRLGQRFDPPASRQTLMAELEHYYRNKLS